MRTKIAAAIRIPLLMLLVQPMIEQGTSSLLHADEPKRERPSGVVDFKNELIPMFTKSGCNTGKCHGSAIGRGEFKLSLYGGNPKADYLEIKHRFRGRRVNLSSPDSSLIYLKPLELMEHGGGNVIQEESEHALLLKRWIEQGAKYIENRVLSHVEVTPQRFLAEKVNDGTQLKAIAHYSDGSTLDVTSMTQFAADDPSAVTINTEKATARANRPGRHIVIARYSTVVLPVEILVPMNTQHVKSSPEKATNFIDEHIHGTLAELRLPVSPEIGDSEFIRRVSLDLVGRLPQSYPATFSSPLNREQVVDQLLQSKQFVAYYTHKLAKLFRIQSKVDKNRVVTTPEAARAFHQWISRQLNDQVGYDQLARDIITAVGDTASSGPAAFFTLAEDPQLQTELVTEIFMGSRMKCANCHNHPLDQWTQDDFHGLAAMFAKITRRAVIRLNPIGKNIHPNTGEAAVMRIPGGEYLPAATTDGRVAFANWLTEPDNPYFAKAIVNRLWKQLMGRGLVEPVDDFRATNPATHPDLLNELANDFIQNGYDIRHTLRLICTSRAYARSSVATEGNQADDRYYSHLTSKPLEPEVLADSISDVLGVVTRYESTAIGTRAIELNDGGIRSDALDILGRCDLTNSCENAPSQVGPLATKLHLFNGELLNDRIGAPGGRLDRLIKSGATVTAIIHDFYRIALSRLPTPEEKTFLISIVDPARPAAQQVEELEDIVWGILCCKEFSTNH